MRRQGNTWVTDEPDMEPTEAWDAFWSHMAGEIARIRLLDQDADKASRSERDAR